MREIVPFKLTIEKRSCYLYASYECDPVTLSDVIATVNGIAKSIAEHGCDRVLLVRNSPLLGSEDNRQILIAMMRNRVPSGIKFALVDVFGNDPGSVAPSIEAMKTVGWDMTALETIEEAEAWLASV